VFQSLPAPTFREEDPHGTCMLEFWLVTQRRAPCDDTFLACALLLCMQLISAQRLSLDAQACVWLSTVWHKTPAISSILPLVVGMHSVSG
jgi:hypothetical protein